MLFPEFDFLYFFVLVLVFNWFLRSKKILWQLFLLFVSYLFYYFFVKNFLFLLIFVTLINYLLGFLIFEEAVYKGKRKNVFFLLAVIFNLFILFVFKYYDFFRSSFEFVFSKLGLPVFPFTLNLILPIGLSFYIFRIISFHFEILEYKIFPYPNLLEFSLFVSFFPYLLSGPLVRASEFFPQLKKKTNKTIENFYFYITLILIGIFKKLILSSWLISELVEDVFSVPENHSFLAILLSIFSYSLVIYFDFSSYSDLAVGFAGLLGFKTPLNFNYPYLALNLKDFWRKWHITLSNWARDYIYIPLGGNRKGRLRKYFNLFLVMLFIGLWHGATLNFILWGSIHAFGLIFTHFLEDYRLINFSGFKFFSSFFTFIFVSFAWVFFGTKSIENSFLVFKGLFSPSFFLEPIKLYLLFLFIFGLFFVFLEKKIFTGLIFLESRLPSFLTIFYLFLLFFLIYKLAPDTIPSFIYFSY
jgi:D-alanyl-lipoteichoic acid acyltransferase DltB (MBOAT superfamily)